jgi:hypothetical protein
MANKYMPGLMAIPLLAGVGMFHVVGAQDARPTYDPGPGPGYREAPPETLAPLPRQGPAAGSAATAPASSSPDAVIARDARSAGGLQQIQSDQGIRYVSGGVGEDERAALDAVSNQFNLRLIFAMQGSGEYLAWVRVNISDTRGGTALAAESHGPWFLVQLPPGEYVVEASAPGQTAQQPQRQTARVDGSHQTRLDFRWH